jgi:hypothetical protein
VPWAAHADGGRLVHLGDTKVLVAELLNQKAIAQLSAACQVEVKYSLSQEDMPATISEYHGIIVRSETLVDRAFRDAAASLRIVGRAGSGLNSIDVPYATHAPHSNVPGVIGRVGTIMGEFGVEGEVPQAAIDHCLDISEIHEFKIVNL